MWTGHNFQGATTHPCLEGQLQIFTTPNIKVWIIGAQQFKEFTIYGKQATSHGGGIHRFGGVLQRKLITKKKKCVKTITWKLINYHGTWGIILRIRKERNAKEKHQKKGIPFLAFSENSKTNCFHKCLMAGPKKESHMCICLYSCVCDNFLATIFHFRHHLFQSLGFSGFFFFISPPIWLAYDSHFLCHSSPQMLAKQNWKRGNHLKWKWKWTRTKSNIAKFTERHIVLQCIQARITGLCMTTQGYLGKNPQKMGM